MSSPSPTDIRRPPPSPRSAAPIGLLIGLTALITLLVPGCGDGPVEVPDPQVGPTFSLTGLSTDTLVVMSGRRSREPFRVRASLSNGSPAVGVRVRFQLSDASLGFLSQSLAVSDSTGVAESWLLQARPGAGQVQASSGSGSTVAMDFLVERAPGSLVFEPGTGAVGLPGLAHPDSVVRLRVLDTEGEPMPGRQVYFSANGRLSSFTDSTDADGWAETRLGVTNLGAGPGNVFGFLLEYPELLAQTSRPVVAPAERVVLVSVDGLRADATTAPDLATFAALRSGGGSGVARTISPSLTVPAHLSMLSGVDPTEHGVFSEVLEFTPQMNALEPPFRITVREGGDTRAFMAADGPLAGFEEILACRLAFGFEALVTVSGGAARIMEAALPAVADSTLTGVFIHLPDPDRAGHEYGFHSDEYRAAVRGVDQALGALMDSLPENTLLLVTSDHGGGGDYGAFQHGSSSDVDALVPLLLFGPGVVPGSRLNAEVSILDVAPTLVWALGRIPPADYQGTPRIENFRNP